jgi:hypothetical protein
MSQPRTHELPRVSEITEETVEIPPGLSRGEIRRRLSFCADRLQVDPGAVTAAWLAPLSGPSLGVGEA